ncbi:MAG: alpha-amylase family glycosyl hydrolase [Janthinobacterium lividum]
MKNFTLGCRWLLGLLLVLGWAGRAQAQVTADPVFFTDTTPVTLTFDATQGNAGLANYAGDVYIYTGVITNLSTSSGDWKHVANTTGYNSPTAVEKMTALGNHKYSITFTPRTYYPGLAASTEVVQKLAMVFRGTGGTPEGKGPGGADIFVNVAQGTAFQVAFTSPTTTGFNPTVVAAGSSVSVVATASSAATLTLLLNGTQVAQQANATTITASVPVTQPGVNTLTVTATSGSTTATATTTVLVPPTPPTAALPAGAKADGITYLAGGTSVILSLTAPSKSYVYVVGDFNNWQLTNAGLLNQTPTLNSDPATGRWWVQVDGLTPGTEYAYQFVVDGNLRVADPYCDKVLDAGNDPYINTSAYTVYPGLKAYPTGLTSGIVSVLQPGQTAYSWTTTSFQRPARTNMVVYELLVRDFVARHDYKTVMDSLGYLQRLGVNTLELMPINEFEGNDGWGYNPSFYFAPDKYYGTKTALKQLVDACHARGMAVVMDMVLNHSCGTSPMVQLYFNSSTGQPAAGSPWFNQTAPHPYNVCYDFNHTSAYTTYFTKQVIKYWLQEYHMDGYRFDLGGGFTQTASTEATFENYDAQRIAIWKGYYDYQKSVDATSYPILEHFPFNQEGKELADYGLMLWGNLNYAYTQAAMGYGTGWDMSYGYYKDSGRNWNQPNLVTYMESHDEERMQFKNKTYGNASGSYSTKDPATGLLRDELATAIFMGEPGPRMIWQFGELGYDYSINTCTDGTTISNDCRTVAKPIRWDYYQQAGRRHLFDTYRALIALRQQAAYAAPTSFVQDLGGAIKQEVLVGADLSVLTVGNFDVTANAASLNFPTTGTWYNYLTGAQLNVASLPTLVSLQPGQYAVYTSRKVGAPAGTTLATRPAETAVFKLSLAPNPASGTTAVAYELPAAATAILQVQSLLGQTVRQLAPVRQPAGAQVQALSLQGLAPGVYLVKLTAGDLTQTTRLLVQ